MTDLWHIDLVQGTDDWKAVRAGKVTGSRLGDVLAGGTGVTRRNYLYQVVAERLSGNPGEDFFTTKAMQDGKDREPLMRGLYEERFEVLVREVGFIEHPSITGFGVSPDGLLLDLGGGIEGKCPTLATHVSTVLDGKIKTDYVLQMQALIECAGLDWCDFVSYHPAMPADKQLYVKRVYRDDAMITKILREVTAFLGEVEDIVSRLGSASYINIGRNA